LQRLGLVVNLTPSRSIVLKIERVPRIGETVVDENLRTVGKVFDVIGPVSSPYAAVKPTMQEPEKLVNEILYVDPSRGERRKRE
jgi:RNA-binding protein